MSTAVSSRPVTRPPATSVPGAARSPLGTAVVALVALGVVGGGTWGLTSPRGASDDAHHSSALATVALSDGTLRVDGLVDEQIGHVMPGMSMPDDVPAGMRRFAVDVSLGATEDEALRYDRRSFTVSGPGVEPVQPVDGQIDRGALPPGSTVSGSLSFQVPEDASALVLQFRDGEAVALPALPAVAGEHDEHGGAEAPAQAPVDDPAPADHHDAPGAAPHDH